MKNVMNLKAVFLLLFGIALAYVGIETPQELFVGYFAFVAGVSVISEFLNQMVGAKKALALLSSWGTGIVLAFVGWLLNLGFLAENYVYYEVAAIGFSASLVANFLWDVNLIKTILQHLGLLRRREE